MSTGLDARTGRAISGLQHIQQSVADILTTPVGSRIERREYGSLLPELIDAPITGRTQVLLYAASATALMRWEPRIRLTRLATVQIEGSKQVLDVQGTLVDGSPFSASVPIYFGRRS